MAADVSSLTDEKIIVVDNIAPGITVDYTTESGKAPTENGGELFYAEVVEDFFVTTNLWVRYFTNKPLFYGSIGGAVLAVGLIIFLIIFKKRKKNEEK